METTLGRTSTETRRTSVNNNPIPGVKDTIDCLKDEVEFLKKELAYKTAAYEQLAGKLLDRDFEILKLKEKQK